MLTSRVLVAIALAILATMIWLDWNFPTPLFYTPVPGYSPVSSLLLFKKTLEISLSLLLIGMGLVVLFWKKCGNPEKFLMSGALGVVIGFWLHPDLFYLLTH